MPPFPHPSENSGKVLLHNKRVSQMQAPLVACRKLAGGLNTSQKVLYVLERKT